MEEMIKSITLGNVLEVLAVIMALVGGIKYMATVVKEGMDKGFEPINEKIDSVDLNSTKNFLVARIGDINRGEDLDPINRERFFEQYEHYQKLGGNSYISAEVERLKKDNKL